MTGERVLVFWEKIEKVVIARKYLFRRQRSNLVESIEMLKRKKAG